MNFEQVIKLLKEGKKVRRKNWGQRKYRYLDTSKQAIVMRNQSGKAKSISPDFLYADDWEIYEEKIRLKTLKELCENRDYIMINLLKQEEIKEIKEIKRLMKENIIGNELSLVKEIKEFQEKTSIDLLSGEKFIGYIKWKFNITEEDLK